jgi:hypothetical protein
LGMVETSVGVFTVRPRKRSRKRGLTSLSLSVFLGLNAI